MLSESDKSFFQSLSGYIEREKERLQCPDRGPDEQRYTIYSHVFDKVIGHATAYKRLLSTIKKEYDDAIRAVKKREEEAKVAQRRLKTIALRPASLMYCQRQAAQLKERIAVVQRNTAEIQEELETLQESRRDRSSSPEKKTPGDQDTQPVRMIPGLTLEESQDLEALARHLEFLEGEREAMLARRRSHYVSLEVKADLDGKLEASESRIDELTLENDRLHLLYKRLSFMSDSLSSWEEAGQQAPLGEFLCSTLEDIDHIRVTDADYHGAEWFEDDDPAKVNESKILVDYMDRFQEIFAEGDYEMAALHAAWSPQGLLRNKETMECFKAVKEYQGRTPLPVLFFRALMTSDPDNRQRPDETLSVEGVRCALEHSFIELVAYAVTQHKLTFSEALGDVLSEHARKEPGAADLCLALAHQVYRACGVHRKAALSMCKRGMIHGALDFMCRMQDFTAEDCIWVLCGCPSLSLLQLLTEPYEGRAAMLSVGQACYLLLLSTQQKELALQLLDSLRYRGGGVFEREILEDSLCSVEDWGEIADLCAKQNRTRLAQEILSVLLAQSGTARLSPDPEGARLMEHVFL
ncbi:clathrin heavy chain linker domain-containing protein 1-like [Polymixia lowei]